MVNNLDKVCKNCNFYKNGKCSVVDKYTMAYMTCRKYITRTHDQEDSDMVKNLKNIFGMK